VKLPSPAVKIGIIVGVVVGSLVVVLIVIGLVFICVRSRSGNNL